MLAHLFHSKSRHDFNAVLDAFHLAYDDLSTAYALCDGLEIIAANSAFETLLDLPEHNRRPLFLNRLLHDQQGVERLFAYAGIPVEFSIPKSTTFAIQPWKSATHFSLLTVRDQSHLEKLRSELTRAHTYDSATGTFRQGAFSAKLHRLLRQMDHCDEQGLLCQISFPAPNNQISGLDTEQKNELICDFVEHLHWEFGSDCLISRNDALALTLFTLLGVAPGEEKHVLNQVGRLGSEIAMTHQTSLTIQIGAATSPRDGKTVADLQTAAGLARRSIATPDRPHGWVVKQVSSELVESQLRTESLTQDIPAAISNGDISPHFQPVIEPATNTILGFEALIRWQHPSLGYVSPPDIIELARDAGLLDQLTARTIRTVANQAMRWPENVQFAVNVTPSQLNSALVDLVRQTIRDTSLDPARLEIEVTEDALIEDFEASAKIFARLRAIGVSIAMDDFGSGYTSVGNLRLLNFDKIKIDKTISDGLPHDRRSVAIVRSLMYMARELEVRITVEGIEDEEQLEFLRAFNCGVQGYIYSPPMPPSQLHELKRFLPNGVETERETKVLGIGPRKQPGIGAGKLAR